MSKQTNNAEWKNDHVKRYPELAGKVGLWKVTGEDPNADFGGAHYPPTLGYFSGKYEDVAALAVELTGFWTWGRGGEIVLIEVIPVTPSTLDEFRALRAQKEKLQAELNRLGKMPGLVRP